MSELSKIKTRLRLSGCRVLIDDKWYWMEVDGKVSLHETEPYIADEDVHAVKRQIVRYIVEHLPKTRPSLRSTLFRTLEP
jgi:hypothetical protein